MKDHGDGLIWVHTGDLGKMDEEGFIYFRQRIKRMIVTNGYNVYPSQIENVLEAHEAVHLALRHRRKGSHKGPAGKGLRNAQAGL